jgi:glycosyltransferase involved in cell wall biosynthesis
MRLLIFVNKFDENDDLLGFFVGWVRSLSRNFEKISIVTQYVGKYSEISNLTVYSLNKGKHGLVIFRLFYYYKYLFQLRREYDLVFVLMAPSWAIASCPILKLLGKKMALWYAVWKNSPRLHLATFLCNKVISSIPQAFPFRTDKLITVGQGIDVEYFKPNEAVREGNRILFLGRISPIKKIEVLFKALALLKVSSDEICNKISVDIVGSVASKKDAQYLDELKNLSQALDIEDKINWIGKVPHSDILKYYQKAGIFVNLTPVGSFDKAMLEAMACGDILLASNNALADFFNEEQKTLFLYKQNDSEELIKRLKHILSMNPDEIHKFRIELRDVIIKNHSQENLVRNLTNVLKSL